MFTKIHNYESLGRTQERKDLLEILESGLQAIDTKEALRKIVTCNGTTLTVEDKQFNLADFDNIALFAFGKASTQACTELEAIIGDHISYGIGLDKGSYKSNKIQIFEGTHPIPSKINADISEHIADKALKLTEKDLAIVVVSGGGSSLLCYPESECDQGAVLYDMFLPTGGSIIELNTLRKHISHIKGGGFSKMLYPATVVALIFCDVPGDYYQDVASGPTYKDETTVDQAAAILEKYNIRTEFTLNETPKEDIYFEKVYNIPVVSNTIALDAMKRTAEMLGYRTILAGKEFSQDMDLVLTTLFGYKENKTVILGGGEPLLTVHNKGIGGRNEAMAVKALEHLKPGDTFASIASDGIDNISHYAGGIVDYTSKEALDTAGIMYKGDVSSFNLETLLETTHDTIETGVTGSNISDLFALLRV